MRNDRYKQALVQDLTGSRRYGWFPVKGLKVGSSLGGLKVLEVYQSEIKQRCEKCSKLVYIDVIRCGCA